MGGPASRLVMWFNLCRERSSDPAEDGFDRYVGLEHLDPGDLKIRRWGNIVDGTLSPTSSAPGRYSSESGVPISAR